MNPISLYIHWPFCVTKCPYCDFNSHVRPDVDHMLWRAALLADLAHEAAATRGHRLVSIFFGGGTPSLMPPETVAALIDAALDHWPCDPDLEITLEANPSSVEAAAFAGFAAAGINRVSLGLQALDDAALRLLGRPHDLAEGLAALDLAQRHFQRVSIDLIHSRPHQTPDQWDAELTRALGFGTDHLSAYQLTIEPGTRFQSLAASGRLPLPDEDQAAVMFETTAARCTAAGLPPYEISNHAGPGSESRHNLAYWTYAPYAGIGPGAHGRRGGTAARGRRGGLATQRLRRPEAWLTAVEASGHGIESTTLVSPPEAATEALLMGLRLTAGIDRTLFEARTGVALSDAINPAARDRLASLGMVAADDPLRVTPAGRGVTNTIIAELAADVTCLETVAADASYGGETTGETA